MPVFVNAVEISRQLIKLFLRQRIVFVVVAPRATKRQPHKHGRGRIHAIYDVFDSVLFGHDAAFGVDAMVAIEGRGDALIERRVRQ